MTEATDMDYVPVLARWLHFLAGIMWIGLRYYFNFVQVPALKAAGADGTAAGITKHVAPRALLYFRWSAVATWLSSSLKPWVLRTRKNCSISQRCLYQSTMRQARSALATGWVVRSRQCSGSVPA